MTCPVCGAELRAVANDRPTITTCSSCGVGVTFPPPRRDVTSDGLFEEGSYAGTRLARRNQWMSEAAQRMDWVGRFLTSGVILEIGCATGELLRVATDRGWECHGIETSGWAARVAAEFVPEAEIFHGGLSAWLADPPEVEVDAVALFHVLEHVHEPAKLLAQVHRAMRPGALLFIELPNWGSSDARRDQADWHLALVEDHVAHYTLGSLRSLLRHTGFRVVEFSEETWRMYDSPRTWLRRRAKDLVRGRFFPSRDLLRVVAQRPQREF